MRISLVNATKKIPTAAGRSVRTSLN